jgi:hypothetical protein
MTRDKVSLAATQTYVSPPFGGRVFMDNTTPAQRSCIGRIGDCPPSTQGPPPMRPSPRLPRVATGH